MDNCINKFLVNYKQGNIEKHSDSSDFDETHKTPITPRLSAKGGKHSLLNKQDEITKATKEISQITYTLSDKNQHLNPNTMYDNIPVHDYDVTNFKCKRIHKKESSTSRCRGDNSVHQETFNLKTTGPHEISCFSNILKQSHNNTKPSLSIKEITHDNLNNGKTSCPDCERRRLKKFNRCRQSYVVQPVYAVDNIQGGPVPFGHANDRAPLSQHAHKAMRKQGSNTSYELTSSESDIGNKNQRKCSSRRRNFIDRFEKEMRNEYVKYETELLRNRVQQYPSKRDKNSPYHVFSTPYCQITHVNTPQCGDQSVIPSTSSGFWEYLFEKIRGKRQCDKEESLKPCYCKDGGKNLSMTPPSEPKQDDSYSAEICVHYKGKAKGSGYKEIDSPECKNCMQQTENLGRGNAIKTSEKIGTHSEKGTQGSVICKCFGNKKRNQKGDTRNSQKSLLQTSPGDVIRPCQEPHDDITRKVEDKYNGEILCIHNPPCILINGCLNLPAADCPSSKTHQKNIWAVTQDKKSSFYHICRKMKRSKNNCEQACQYHPPSVDVQRAMQIKTEKLVQSICNHDPPCEVVYGCYRAKYDPKLDNSCVHVPMCQRLPQCLIEDRVEGETQNSAKLCEHKPKCNELPLCSRKFFVLTAKGTVGTQVRPRTKLVCRHEPPCIMIPKCLARVISNSYLPFEAIPDCVHQPCCEMIPACCRKAAKEMVSVSSQYPNAPCRIV